MSPGGAIRRGFFLWIDRHGKSGEPGGRKRAHRTALRVDVCDDQLEIG